MSFWKIFFCNVSIFASLFAGICLRMPFVTFIQGYSPGHLNYVACTFIFIFFPNKYALYDKKSLFPAVYMVLRW